MFSKERFQAVGMISSGCSDILCLVEDVHGWMFDVAKVITQPGWLWLLEEGLYERGWQRCSR